MNVPMSDLRLTAAKENYMLDNRAAGLKPKTLRSYCDTLEKFISFTGDITVRELAPDHVRLYMAELMSHQGRYGEFSTHSVAKHYSVIRTWVRWMYAQKIIAERITDYVKPPRLSSRLPSHLSDEEVDALLSGIGNFRDMVIIELFLDTGLRLNDVHELDLQDINLEDGWVRVIGKGDKEAVVPMGAKLCRDIHSYIHIHRHARDGERALFINRAGFRLGYEGLSTMVRRELTRVRGPEQKHGAHTLRHTAGTNLVRGGANLEVVRRVLRHSDIKTTQIYVHLADQDVFEGHRRASPIDRRSKTQRKRRST